MRGNAAVCSGFSEYRDVGGRWHTELALVARVVCRDGR